MILGINGQLGSSFLEFFVRSGLTVLKHDHVSNTCLIDLEFKSISKFSPRLDISDKDALQEIILITNPDVVINCCAATDVDLIEKFPASGISTNVIGSLNLN